MLPRNSDLIFEAWRLIFLSSVLHCAGWNDDGGAPIVVNGTAIEPGRPVALFHTRILGAGTEAVAGTQYDVARDGRFLINTVLEDHATAPITLLMNWKPPAK